MKRDVAIAGPGRGAAAFPGSSLDPEYLVPLEGASRIADVEAILADLRGSLSQEGLATQVRLAEASARRSRPVLPRLRSLSVLTLVVGVCAIYVLLPGSGLLTRASDLLLVNSIQVAGAVVCLTLCWLSARRMTDDAEGVKTGLQRRAWRFIGVAAGFWAAGQIYWTWHQATSVELPFPSLADVGFLTSVGLTGVALLMLPSLSHVSLGRVRVLLDGLIIALSLLGVVWLVSLRGVIGVDGTSWLEKSIAVAYPVADVVNLSIALTVLVHSRRRELMSLVMLAGGIFAIGVADLAFLYATQRNDYVSGGPADLGWVLGFVLIGLAALRRIDVPGHLRTPRFDAVLTFGAPGLAVVTLLLTAVGRTLIGGDLGRFFIVEATVVIMLLLIRYLMFVLDGVAMSDRLVRSSDRLLDEAMTMNRTADAVRIHEDEQHGSVTGPADDLAMRMLLLKHSAADMRSDSLAVLGALTSERPPGHGGLTRSRGRGFLR